MLIQQHIIILILILRTGGLTDWLANKVEKEDSLEAILLALHLPADEVEFIITDFTLNFTVPPPGEVGPQPEGGRSLQGGV